MKIVVTGASKGLGEDIVKYFSDNGHTTISLSSKNSVDNKNVFFYHTDIRDYSSVKKSFSLIKEDFGDIDILINNASIFSMKKLLDMDIEEIDNIIDTNLKGTIYCTFEAVNLINKGRIINIGSVSGVHGIENQSVYSSSKFGVVGFSESLNQEIIKNGIKITTLCPGGIDTTLWQQHDYPGDKQNLLKSKDIIDVIEYVTKLADNVVMKTMTIFPTNEWH